MLEYNAEELLERIRKSDESAATELFDRYVGRMIELAGSRLSPKLARRIDPEDVIQSACRSFFRQAREGGYWLNDGHDLWSLLAAITVNKVRKAVKRHNAAMRSVACEESAARDSVLRAIQPESLARDPSPEEAAILVEETQTTLHGLTDLQRQILELRLQGCTIEETARRAACSERTSTLR